MPSTQDVINFRAAKQAYWDNADYEETGSLPKALAFRTAVRRLIGILPRTQTHGDRGGESITFDIPELRRQLDDVKTFVTAKSGTPGGFSFIDVEKEYCR